MRKWLAKCVTHLNIKRLLMYTQHHILFQIPLINVSSKSWNGNVGTLESLCSNSFYDIRAKKSYQFYVSLEEKLTIEGGKMHTINAHRTNRCVKYASWHCLFYSIRVTEVFEMEKQWRQSQLVYCWDTQTRNERK